MTSTYLCRVRLPSTRRQPVGRCFWGRYRESLSRIFGRLAYSVASDGEDRWEEQEEIEAGNLKINNSEFVRCQLVVTISPSLSVAAAEDRFVRR